MAYLAISFLLVFTFFPLIIFSAIDELPDRTVPEDNMPSTLYRADLRSPDDLFENGMRSIGTNDDLKLHVQGQSCHYASGPSRALSAFISSSASKDEANKHINKILRKLTNVNTAYVYQIRPTQNFFSVTHSMLHFLDKKKQQEPESSHEGLEKLIAAQEQMQEWVAKYQIDASQIISAERFIRPEPGLLIRFTREVLEEAELTKQINSKYEDVTTTASNQPYVFEEARNTPENLINAVVTFGRRIYSTCTFMCSRRATNTSPSPESRKDTIIEDIGCFTQTSVLLDLTEVELEVWDFILDREILKLVPWRQTVKDENNHNISHPNECTVDVGEVDEHKLKVRCDHEHNLYRRFYVSLWAYRSGSFIYWSDEVAHKYKVNVGVDWEIDDTQIMSQDHRGINHILNNGGSRTFTVAEVFRNGNNWKNSKIRVLPIYPEES